MRRELIKDAARLHEIAPAWACLWRATNAGIFQHPHWLIPWWEEFHPGALHTLALWDGPQLCAIAPFFRANDVLFLLGTGISDEGDVLSVESAYQNLSQALSERPHLVFDELAPHATTLQIPAPENTLILQSQASPSPLLTLSQGIPALQKRKLRMAHHRLQRAGGGVIECATDAASFFNDLARLSRHDLTPLRAFHTRVIPQLPSLCLSLHIGTELAACFYGFIEEGRRALAYLGAYDPAFARFSPGALLIEAAIAEAARQGCTTFDFLRGDEPYKFRWGAQMQHHQRLEWRAIS